MNIDDELRERAKQLTANPGTWMQGEPGNRHEQCLVFKGGYGTVNHHRALSKSAEQYLERFLYRYLVAQGISREDLRYLGCGSKKRLGYEAHKLVSVTAYNDLRAESVEDVVEMLEKAAAEYDGSGA